MRRGPWTLRAIQHLEIGKRKKIQERTLRRNSHKDMRKPGSEDAKIKILGHSCMQMRDPKQRGECRRGGNCTIDYLE